MMVNRQDAGDEFRRQRLSALMDGEHAADEADEACLAWRDDPEARAQWHSWHLIGDVLRADDLAADPARDAVFLQRLRSRLADEPVPMAPAPLLPLATSAAAAVVPVARRGHWLVAPMAVAAGFVAVAGVLVVLRSQAPADGAAPQLASATLADTAASGVMTVSGEVALRDAGLDRYLSAHRRVSNTVSMVVPGGVVRSADALVLSEPK